MERPSKLGRWIDRHALWVALTLAVIGLGGRYLWWKVVNDIVQSGLDNSNKQFRNSGCFQAGWDALLSNPEAGMRLGDHFDIQGPIYGRMPTRSIRGSATFRVLVVGDDKQAWLEIDCEAGFGEWELRSVLLTNPPEKIHMRIVP